MEETAGILGRAAREHAGRTHNPKINKETLLQIYRQLS